MGRGRAKAKQTKVARELKYSSPGPSDLERLKAELAAGGGPIAPAAPKDDEDDLYADPYAVDDSDDDERDASAVS
ncbi:MAG TPA: DUF3073 domain-containing protein [Mycobacteriales bacterium]|nr:DUF3073 domain-containing protein [Mycobacteriales bacterium]